MSKCANRATLLAIVSGHLEGRELIHLRLCVPVVRIESICIFTVQSSKLLALPGLKAASHFVVFFEFDILISML